MSTVDPLQHLTSDHRNFVRLLAVLDEELDRIDREEHANFELIQDVMEYMTQYPDLVHHPTENMLADYLVTQRAELAPEARRLASEHETLAARGREFREAVSNVVDGALALREVILEAGRVYVELQRKHIDWEEAMLFPQARGALRPQDIEEIDNALRAARDPLFGPVRDADYAELWRYIERQRVEGRG